MTSEHRQRVMLPGTPRDQPCLWCVQMGDGWGITRVITWNGGPHKEPCVLGVCKCGVIRRHQRDMEDPKRHLKGPALFLVCPGCGSAGGMLIPRGPTPSSSSASFAC